MVVLEARVVDSTHLELSRPIDTPLGRKVVISVTEAKKDMDEHALWLAASAEGLRSAFGDSEPEYTLDMVKEPNPELAP